MKRVARDELLGIGAYEQIREPFRARIIAEKKRRRFSPSPELSVVFENHDTVLFQIEEMLRTERITKEAAIQHELDTYNELIPSPGELSATMFVEIAERDPREARLVELAGLEHELGLEIDGRFIAGRNETRGLLPDRTTAVHYLKFSLAPEDGAAWLSCAAAGAENRNERIAFLVRHPKLAVRTFLPVEVVRAVAEDLATLD